MGRVDLRVQLLSLRRTKIVATLGPSSDDEATIDELVAAGVDVFRLNMSHGEQEEHRRRFEIVRRVAQRRGRLVAVLADLSGPKIRVGRFAGGGIDLVDGEAVTVTTREVEGRQGLVPSQYPQLADDVRPGDRVLLDDGNLELRVERVEGTEIECVVVHGGRLTDRKGINLPGVAVSAPALTDKDREDARFALELGVDLLALSFVRRASDVHELREIVDGAECATTIIAKIEKPEALEDIDAILEAADGIMVARGDLGVELPPQEVPMAQEQLVELARARAKPVIVATQMLESMIERPRPTRAEVSDVALAVRSGADAVMLSGETASGAHPVAAVKMMDTVARQVEGYLFARGAFGGYRRDGEAPVPVAQALARATSQLSRDLRVRAIVVVTRHGATASVMSASRPAAPVVAVTADPTCARGTSLLWGVRPLQVAAERLDDPIPLAREVVAELGLGERGQTVLVVQGFRFDPAASVPSLTVVTL